MAEPRPGPVEGDEYSTEESESCDLHDTEDDDAAQMSNDQPPPSPAIAGSGQTDVVSCAVFTARDRYLMTKLIGRTLRRFSSDMMIESSAVAATLQAAEAYLTGLMVDTAAVARPRGGDKITRMDLLFAMRIRGEDRAAPTSGPQAPGFAFGAGAPQAPPAAQSTPLTLYGFGGSQSAAPSWTPPVGSAAPTVAAPPPATADPTQTQDVRLRVTDSTPHAWQGSLRNT